MIWENTKSSLNLGKRLDFSFRGIIWCIFTLMELFFHKRYWGGWFSHTHYQGVIGVQTWDNWSANQSSFHWARPVATNGAFVVDLMYFQRMVEVKGSKDSPRLTWYFPRRPPNRTRSEFIYTNKTKKKKSWTYIYI